jgi:hypothetical protein
MEFYRRYSLLIGGLILAVVVVALFSIPGEVIAKQATFIGTELHHSSENEVCVKTKMDLGSPEHMQNFPMQFGRWIGLDFGESAIVEELSADLILLRTYLYTGGYQPLNLIVVQAREPSAFHSPGICYRAAGWEIQDEGIVELLVSGQDWASASGPVAVSAKRIYVARYDDGDIVECEVVLFFYVKGRLFEDTVTMVEVTADVPMSGSYDKSLQNAVNFMEKTIPFMFASEMEGEDKAVAFHLSDSLHGSIILGLLVLVPLAVAIFPRIRQCSTG